jgi:hypothetical protein
VLYLCLFLRIFFALWQHTFCAPGTTCERHMGFCRRRVCAQTWVCVLATTGLFKLHCTACICAVT